jgi:alkanesulfonate monooxygenase SsuD/methylene tetrahydromethanopterin reductase-like flavin-dependent oxidoreductase (luciferase family)
VREIAKHAAVGGRGPVVVGSPEEVAEELIAWVEETDVDRFNLAYAVDAGDFCRFCRSGRARAAEARPL